MTIKQQGGVFGRNPTFNDVDVEGNLTVIGASSTDTLSATTGTFSTVYASTSVAVGAAANYQATFYKGGANANYVQVSNGMLGAGPLNGILYGVDASGNGVLNKQGTGDLITTVAGIERLRILQAGTLDVSAANISFDSGYGIDFSATSGTGTSELFDDYEEGTWTPVATSITVNSGTPVWSGTYTKIGRTVVAQWSLSGGANIDVSLSSYLSLPFTAAGNSWGTYGIVSSNTHVGGMVTFGSSLYFGTASSGLVSASGTITFQV